MVDQARQRQATGWTKDAIRRLEIMWLTDVSNAEIAAAFGFSNAKTLQKAVRALRVSGRAKLPKRRHGKRASAITLAARARGCDTKMLERRLLGVLNAQGAVLIDNLLDDDVTTETGKGA